MTAEWTEPVLLALHGLRGVGKDTTIQLARDWVAESDPTLSVVRGAFGDKMKWAYMRQWVPTCTQQWAIDFIDQYKNDTEAACAGIYVTDDGVLLDNKKLMEGNDEDYPFTFIPPVIFRNHMDQFATESAREVYGDDFWVDQLLPLGMDRVWPLMPAWHGSFLVKRDENTMVPASFAFIADLRAHNEMERVKQLPNSLCVKIKRKDREAEVRAAYEGREVHLFSRELPDSVFDVIINNDDNNMDNAKIRTRLLMHEIVANGVASIKRGLPRPWVI